MTSTTFFFVVIPFIAILLLMINFLLSPHNPYLEKLSIFECGYHSFLGQNRTQFAISFFIFGLLFLVFDLEILLVYPVGVSLYNVDTFGLFIMLGFFTILTLGFVYELGKNALKIDSRQMFNFSNKKMSASAQISSPSLQSSLIPNWLISSYRWVGIKKTVSDIRLRIFVFYLTTQSSDKTKKLFIYFIFASLALRLFILFNIYYNGEVYAMDKYPEYSESTSTEELQSYKQKVTQDYNNEKIRYDNAKNKLAENREALDWAADSRNFSAWYATPGDHPAGRISVYQNMVTRCQNTVAASERALNEYSNRLEVLNTKLTQLNEKKSS